MAGPHFDSEGRARMVDVSAKPKTRRTATARGRVRMDGATLDAVGNSAKGDVIAVAELAGIMAAKQTGTLIPLCHLIGLDSVTVRIETPGAPRVTSGRSALHGTTGVEMKR